jgi:hypothetical protein
VITTLEEVIENAGEGPAQVDYFTRTILIAA